jgi:hypothetical protein
MRHPSEDRWRTSRCRSLHPRGGLPNWTSRDTISPRMSRDPRASATDLTKGGGSPRPEMMDTCEGSSAPSLVRAANRTVSPRMFRGVRLEPKKVRGDPCRDSAGPCWGGGRTFEGRVPHLSVSDSSPARWAAELDESRHDLAEDVARPSRVGDRSHEAWRLSSAGDDGHLRGWLRTLLGCRCQPNGIAEDVPRCPS